MLEEGFDDFLGKPMDLTELENVLIRFLKDMMEEVQEAEKEETGLTLEIAKKYEGLIQKGVDVQAGIELCGGEESYREVLRAFLKNAQAQQRDLFLTLKQQDYQRYTVLAHALKSASASIGALKLSEFARMHDEAGNKRNLSYINEDFVNLMEEYREIVKAIETGDISK